MTEAPAQSSRPGTTEFAIQLYFARRTDGRFHVYSPNVPGLHLHGRDLATIRSDVEPIIKDLLYFNSNVIIDDIRGVPSHEEMVKRMAPHQADADDTPEDAS